MKDTKFEILVPTRNRPESVVRLLKSLTDSAPKPSKVVLVSSGIDISNEVAQFVDLLKIKHIHTDVSGQVNQKKIGITHLDPGTEWVVFLDDDLLIEADTIMNALSVREKYLRTHKDIVGIGFDLPVTQRLNSSSKSEKLIARLFGLSNSQLGSVTSSGQGVSYLGSSEPIFTKWLNGASMWKIESVKDYLDAVPSSSYAACEDLVFSYSQSRSFELLYVPSAKVRFQSEEPNYYNNELTIKSAAAWRYFFVKSNPNLSLVKLSISQVGRLAYVVFRDPSNLKAIKASLVSLKWIVVSSIFDRKPEHLMKKYL